MTQEESMSIDEALRVADQVSPLPSVASQALRTLASELEHARKAQAFTGMALDEFPDLGTLDPYDLGKLATKAGLLQPQTMTVPCSDSCACAEYCETGAETQCFRATESLRRCFDVSKQSNGEATHG